METGAEGAAEQVVTVVEAVRQALHEEMARDERVMVLGQDVARKGGVFLATEGLLERFGPERVLDTPISESLIVGVAIGASLNGLIPVAEIQFADYIYPGIDQIVNEAAKMRYRTDGDWSCPLVVRMPYGAGIHGALYHSQSVEAVVAHVPGLKVVTPSNPRDAKGLLKAAIRDPDPVIFLEHKKTYRLIKGPVPPGDYTVPIGAAAVARPGRDATVIAYGYMVHVAVAAAEQVAAEDGFDAEVIDLRTLRPLDREMIVASARRTGKVLIVHEDNLTGGLGAELAAIIGEEAFEHLEAPVARLAGPDVPAVPYAEVLEDWFLPNEAKIAAALRALAAA